MARHTLFVKNPQVSVEETLHVEFCLETGGCWQVVCWPREQRSILYDFLPATDPQPWRLPVDDKRDWNPTSSAAESSAMLIVMIDDAKIVVLWSQEEEEFILWLLGEKPMVRLLVINIWDIASKFCGSEGVAEKFMTFPFTLWPTSLNRYFLLSCREMILGYWCDINTSAASAK